MAQQQLKVESLERELEGYREIRMAEPPVAQSSNRNAQSEEATLFHASDISIPSANSEIPSKSETSPVTQTPSVRPNVKQQAPSVPRLSSLESIPD